MGIYSKKKKFNVIKSAFYFLIFFMIIVFVYSYLNFKSDINSVFLNEKNESLDINKKEQSTTSAFNENILQDLVKMNELDQNIENFIKNNPELILNSLKDYQNKQNKIQQENMNNLNITNINKIYSDEHTMFIGNINADNIIFEFVDYNCGYCVKFHDEVKKVINNDSNLKLVIIQMPILGNMSKELSNIAIASSFQNKFQEVHNYFYSPDRKSKIDDIFADLFLMGVDLVQLESDLDSNKIKEFSSIHQGYVNDFKFTGTPAIIIGKSIIPGFIEADKILEILNKEFY